MVLAGEDLVAEAAVVVSAVSGAERPVAGVPAVAGNFVSSHA